MIGKIFGHYKIVEILGKGGMGVVYKARDTKLERDVAIKVLAESVLKKTNAVNKFKKEAKHHAQLVHANIVTVYGFIEEDNILGIVMEYANGESLDKTIYRQGRLQFGDALFVLKQVLKGLEYAHSRGFVHRDIKPSNIIVNSEGIAKIMDFGISVSVEDENSRKTGAKAGTSYYMSPEQVRGRTVNNKSDIYCLGTTLYEMLTGQPPFYYEAEDDVMRAHINEKPVPVSQKIQGMPKILDDLVKKSMEKDPVKRFANCEDFFHNADQIDMYLAKIKNEYINGKKSTKKLSKPFSILGISIIFALVAGIIYFSFLLVDEFFKTNQVDKYREFSLVTLFQKDIDLNRIKSIDVNVSVGINDILFANEETGFAVGNKGIVLETTDSGKTWQKSIPDSNSSFKSLFITQNKKVFIVGENGTLFSKDQSEKKWNKIEIKSKNTFNTIHFIDNQNGLIVGSKGEILRTSDGGKSWIKTVTPVENLLFDVDFTSKQRGIAVGWKGTFLETTDGGYKWQAVAPFTNKYIKAVDFMDDKVGIAVCGGGKIYRTNDSGKTWNLIKVDVNSPLNDVRFFDENRCLAVGNKGTVLYSDNWGKNWKIVKSGTFVNLNSIFITKNKTLYITGLNGTILKF